MGNITVRDAPPSSTFRSIRLAIMDACRWGIFEIKVGLEGAVSNLGIDFLDTRARKSCPSDIEHRLLTGGHMTQIEFVNVGGKFESISRVHLAENSALLLGLADFCVQRGERCPSMGGANGKRFDASIGEVGFARINRR